MGKSKANLSWISVADLMTAMMMVFMFIAISFMFLLENEKEIYRLELNKALHSEFDSDLLAWKAEITDKNIVRFNAPFSEGSDVVSNDFKKILSEFFPRYAKLLYSEKFKPEIAEIRVEGHTSYGWGKLEDEQKIYLKNMYLSQDRASNVLTYSYQQVGNNEQLLRWLEKKLRANGMAYSKPILDDSMDIDPQSSRRVEFRAMTKEHY